MGRSKVVMRSISLEDECRLLGKDSTVAGDESPVAVVDLSVPGSPHDLSGGVADVMHAARQARLTETELTACGVEREVTAERQVVVRDEGHALALLAEPGVFEAQQHRDRV